MKTSSLRNKMLICLLFSSILHLASATDCHPAEWCTGPDATLDCLKKHPYELYSENRDLFWKILNEAADKAEQCSSHKATADFLSLVHITRGGSLAKYFSEHMENLCVSKTECFLDAVLLLDRSDRERLIYTLYFPIFKKSSEITDALGNYRDTPKYKRVIDLYMKKFESNVNPR